MIPAYAIAAWLPQTMFVILETELIPNLAQIVQAHCVDGVHRLHAYVPGRLLVMWASWTGCKHLLLKVRRHVKCRYTNRSGQCIG